MFILSKINKAYFFAEHSNRMIAEIAVTVVRSKVIILASRLCLKFTNLRIFNSIKKNRALFHQGKQLHLSQRDFEILLFLVERQGKIITKESILEEIWADSFVEEGNLAVQMSALRNLLGERRGEYKYFQTVANDF